MERKRLKEPGTGSAGVVTEAPADPPSRKPLTHSILNEKLINDFCRLIREGLSAENACNYLGIMPATYYVWMRKGQRYLDGGEMPEEHYIYGLFVKTFRLTVADYVRHLSRRLHSKKAGNWFRDMTILERRDRKTWGRDEPLGGGDDQYDPDDRFL